MKDSILLLAEEILSVIDSDRAELFQITGEAVYDGLSTDGLPTIDVTSVEFGEARADMSVMVVSSIISATKGLEGRFTRAEVFGALRSNETKQIEGLSKHFGVDYADIYKKMLEAVDAIENLRLEKNSVQYSSLDPKPENMVDDYSDREQNAFDAEMEYEDTLNLEEGDLREVVARTQYRMETIAAKEYFFDNGEEAFRRKYGDEFADELLEYFKIEKEIIESEGNS